MASTNSYAALDADVLHSLTQLRSVSTEGPDAGVSARSSLQDKMTDQRPREPAEAPQQTNSKEQDSVIDEDGWEVAGQKKRKSKSSSDTESFHDTVIIDRPSESVPEAIIESIEEPSINRYTANASSGELVPTTTDPPKAAISTVAVDWSKKQYAEDTAPKKKGRKRGKKSGKKAQKKANLPAPVEDEVDEELNMMYAVGMALLGILAMGFGFALAAFEKR